MKRAVVFLSVVAVSMTFGCAAIGMNTVTKLNQLSPGMSPEQVQGILGEPQSTEIKNDKLVQKYTLHENWKGFVPYHMVYNKDTRVLETWYEDEEEYQRMQAQMAQALQPALENQNAGGGGAAQPVGPNDPDLQRWITGSYYYFSSSMVVSASSERTFALCVNGQFRSTGEFGAAQSGEWGAASQNRSGGSWTISGDRQSGTITLSYPDGTSQNVRYQVDSQTEQTMLFNGVKFVYSGVASCG